MISHLSTLTLHQLRYGELDGPALRDVQAHLGSCERCAARLASQEQERAAFVVRGVPAALRGLREEPRPRRRWGFLSELFPFALAAAAAATLFVAVPAMREDRIRDDEVLFKGTLPDVEAWIDQGQGPRVLRNDDVLGAGDRVQLTYDPQGASYIAIAGRDATGTVEVYTTTAPTGIGLVQAPFALTLDGTPGVQELFVVGSDRPLSDVAVKTAVRSGVPGARVSKVVVRKQETHR
jgi:hypothetical protein